MGKSSKDLPVGVYENNQTKNSFIASYSNKKAGIKEMKKSFKTLDEAIKQREAWEEEFGKPSSRSRNQDLTGKRFSYLTVLEKAGKDGYSQLWKCRCDCGNIVEVSTGQLNANKVKSCGCMGRGVRKRGEFPGVYPSGQYHYRAMYKYKNKTLSKSEFKSAEDAYYNGRLKFENEMVYDKNEDARYLYYLRTKKYIETYATDDQMEEFQKLFDKKDGKSKKKED